MPQPKETEEITDLNQVMTQTYFDGVAGFGKGDHEEEEAPTAEADEAAKKEQETGESETRQPSDAAEEGGLEDKEETPDQEAEQQKAEEAEKKEKRMFDSMEQAEQRYKNLQKKLSERDRELKEFRDKAEKTAAEQRWTEDVTKAKQSMREAVRTLAKETMQKINELDPDDENYDDLVADLRAEEIEKRFDLMRDHSEAYLPPPKPQETAPAKEEETPSDQQEDPVKVAMTYLASKLEEEEIPMEDRTFQHFKGITPAKDAEGNSISFEDQVAWAINKTKEHYSLLAGETDNGNPPTDKAKQRQAENLPLGGRGGDHRTERAATGNKKTAAPKSLDDVLSEVERDRIL